MRNKKFVETQVGNVSVLEGNIPHAINKLGLFLEKIPEKYREEATLSFYIENTGYDNGTTCNMYISYYEEKTEEDLARERAQSEEYKRQVRERDLKTIEELKRKHGLC